MIFVLISNSVGLPYRLWESNGDMQIRRRWIAPSKTNRMLKLSGTGYNAEAEDEATGGSHIYTQRLAPHCRILYIYSVSRTFVRLGRDARAPGVSWIASTENIGDICSTLDRVIAIYALTLRTRVQIRRNNYPQITVSRECPLTNSFIGIRESMRRPYTIGVWFEIYNNMY